MSARPVLLTLATCAAVLSGCGPEDRQLQGSLTELVDLGYRKVDVTQTIDELSVRFVMPQGAGENVVLRLTVSLVGAAVNPRIPLDVAEPDTLGNQRGRVGRSVLDDPLVSFPPLRRGSVTFARALQPGAETSGSLNLTFENGTELASGRTVFGDFEATVQ